MTRRTRMIVVACAVLAAAAWIGGFGQDAAVTPATPAGETASNGRATRTADPDGAADPEPPTGTARGRVERVVDGDTVRVRTTAATPDLPAGLHRVRLLGIDAPEMHYETGDPECGAIASTDFLTDLVAGAQVRLEADVEDRDRYDRPLRYLWLDDGTLVNRAIVTAGHARAVLYEPNHRYWDLLRATETDARTAGAGMWGTCSSR